MTDNTNKWIETMLETSGEVGVTKEIILGTIEIVENSLVMYGHAIDLITLDELNDMLCELDNQ